MREDNTDTQLPLPAEPRVTKCFVFDPQSPIFCQKPRNYSRITFQLASRVKFSNPSKFLTEWLFYNGITKEESQLFFENMSTLVPFLKNKHAFHSICYRRAISALSHNKLIGGLWEGRESIASIRYSFSSVKPDYRVRIWDFQEAPRWPTFLHMHVFISAVKSLAQCLNSLLWCYPPVFIQTKLQLWIFHSSLLELRVLPGPSISC